MHGSYRQTGENNRNMSRSTTVIYLGKLLRVQNIISKW
jgi:hypothetical protein